MAKSLFNLKPPEGFNFLERKPLDRKKPCNPKGGAVTNPWKTCLSRAIRHSIVSSQSLKVNASPHHAPPKNPLDIIY
jgi:hypothetical protein